MAERDKFTPVAEQVPYDNVDCDLDAENVKDAIDEICIDSNSRLVSVQYVPGTTCINKASYLVNNILKYVKKEEC